MLGLEVDIGLKSFVEMNIFFWFLVGKNNQTLKTKDKRSRDLLFVFAGAKMFYFLYMQSFFFDFVVLFLLSRNE